MKKRKHMKKAARKSLKKHYLMFVAVCLLAAYLGVEFSTSLDVLNITPVDEQMYTAGETYAEAEHQEVGDGGIIVKKAGVLDILNDMLEGKDEETKLSAQERQRRAIERSENGNPILGRKRGVLAMAVNSISSGSLLVTVVTAVTSMVGSRNTAVLLLILIGTLFFLGFWFFITNIMTVISRRIFLEGRLYEAVPIKRFLFLLRVKRWMRVAWNMFVLSVFRVLWSLTIVGGFIKHYSYYLVPYINAENPNVKACEAITLSRKMMKGHKWECFVLELSFLGWRILGVLTAGLVDIFYTNPYEICTYCEFYAGLRSEARERRLENAGLLDDKYLFEKPEEEITEAVYGDVIEILEKPQKELKDLKGIRRFLADWLGVILLNTKEEQEYEKSQEAFIRIQELKREAEGIAYPGRLSVIPEIGKRKRVESLHFMRHYTIWSLILLFFIFAFIGWTWEVTLHLISDGRFVNRGVLHGPWLPIYGAGGVMILMVLNKLRRHPAAEFIGIVVLCGVVEYFTAYYLEIAHNGKKWWDYTGYFLNLHGRICAEGLLVFGLGGMAIVYFLAPLLDNHIKRLKMKTIVPVCLVLLAVFAGDQVYSKKYPNTGEGITDYQSRRATGENRRM